MKRNAVSTSLKDHNFVTSRVVKDSYSSKMGIGCNKQKVREPWDCNIQGCEQDYMDELAWPPRSYTCSFCMREFRSAQALGGHMNVHRRDRARLRQSPPPPQARNNHHCPLQNHNPNPNFSSSSASFLPTFPPRNHKSLPSALPTLVSQPFSPSSRLSSSSSPPIELQKWVKADAIGLHQFNPQIPETTFNQDNKKLFAFTSKERSEILKKTEIIRLDLEIGLFDDSKEDLDLELRLGIS